MVGIASPCLLLNVGPRGLLALGDTTASIRITVYDRLATNRVNKSMNALTHNKYSRCYFSIVERARTRIYAGYTEKHHILPRSLGGSSLPDNLVRLTPREHFVCHALLARCTEGLARRKMVKALWMFCTKAGRLTADYKITSRAYAVARAAYSRELSAEMTGRRMAEETCAKIAVAVTGEKNGMFGRRTGKKHQRAKQSSPEHREKLRQAKLGKPRSEAAKQSIREGMAKRKALRLESACS